MPPKKSRNSIDVDKGNLEKIHEDAWVAASRGDYYSLRFNIAQAEAINAVLDPMWIRSSSSTCRSNLDLLSVAASSGSKHCVELLIPLVKIPHDDSVCHEHKKDQLSQRVSSRRLDRKVYFLCKPQNPFLEVIRSRGTPLTGKPSKTTREENENQDGRVYETLKALENLLVKLPKPHQSIIMNEGLIFKAAEWGLFQTVRYLVTPELGIDLFHCDSECVGGTYSCVDYAIRQEMRVRNFNIKYSTTKLLWDKTGGIRGTVKSPGKHHGLNERNWLIEKGIISDATAGDEVSIMSLSDSNGCSDNDLDPDIWEASDHDSNEESYYHPSPRCDDVSSIPDENQADRDRSEEEALTDLNSPSYCSEGQATNNVAGVKNESSSVRGRVLAGTALQQEIIAGNLSPVFEAEQWLSGIFGMSPMHASIEQLYEILYNHGFYTCRTLSLLTREIITSIFGREFGLVYVRIFLSESEKLKIPYVDLNQLPQSAKALVNWFDPDMSASDFNDFHAGINNLFGGNIFMFNSHILARVEQEDIDAVEPMKFAHKLLIKAAVARERVLINEGGFYLHSG